MAPRKAAKKPVARKPAKPTKAAPARPARAPRDPTGHADVASLIQKLPARQRAIATALDRLIRRNVPNVESAIRWRMPVYGVPGNGWFGYLRPAAEHVSLGFYFATTLRPQPPEGEGKTMRHVKYATAAEIDGSTAASWIRQAAAIKGWGA